MPWWWSAAPRSPKRSAASRSEVWRTGAADCARWVRIAGHPPRLPVGGPCRTCCCGVSEPAARGTSSAAASSISFESDPPTPRGDGGEEGEAEGAGVSSRKSRRPGTAGRGHSWHGQFRGIYLPCFCGLRCRRRSAELSLMAAWPRLRRGGGRRGEAPDLRWPNELLLHPTQRSAAIPSSNARFAAPGRAHAEPHA